jgi:hypothetical protein
VIKEPDFYGARPACIQADNAQTGTLTKRRSPRRVPYRQSRRHTWFSNVSLRRLLIRPRAYDARPALKLPGDFRGLRPQLGAERLVKQLGAPVERCEGWQLEPEELARLNHGAEQGFDF